MQNDDDEASSALARQAARHPDRPGQQCKASPGVYVPVVAAGKCEAKGPCVDVCPFDVFEIGRTKDADLAVMSMMERLKNRFHGRRTSYVVNPELCQACGLCVVACPEHAIRLIKSQAV